MYDRKSDYALNKQDRDAIVCGSVTGVHIRLTRSDFSSEEEFQKWKAWSDWDYHTNANGDTVFERCCIAIRFFVARSKRRGRSV